jgi:uncharacterized membrane protein YhaH (DUF805 family)
MFGAKYSRLTFWIWSVVLLLPFSVLATFSKATELSFELADVNLVFRILLLIVIIMWMNALANRIRDYGSNPWIALFSLIPLANIGLALYYGIVKYQGNSKKNENQCQNNSDISLAKAVYNHSKDISSEVKPAIREYKQQHTTPQAQADNQHIDLVDEDSIYEQVMLEIEEDRKVKSTWAKAFAQSDGDENKAQAMYITFRVNEIINKEEQKFDKHKDNDFTKKSKSNKLSSKAITWLFIVFFILFLLVIISTAISISKDSPESSKQEVSYLPAETIEPTQLSTRTYSLTINTVPSNATVRILNIKPKYYDGIKLKKGKYHIAVTKDGYQPLKRWISLEQDGSFDVNMTKINIQSKDIFYDATTGLMWQDSNDAKTVQKEWQGAQEYCSNLSLSGYSDWRLPEYNEFLSIVNYSRYNPAIKDGFKNVKSDGYWSSSGSPDYTSLAWSVFFDSGGTLTNNKNTWAYVRCVRGK